MQEGWVCPKCGKVMAPWMPHCDGQHSTEVRMPGTGTPVQAPWDPLPPTIVESLTYSESQA